MSTAAVAAAAADVDDDGYGPNSLGSLGAAMELRSRLQDVDVERRAKRGGRDGDGWEEINGAWVRSPPGRAWGVAHFVGGAVLGSYPHIAYDAFLSRLCDDAGVGRCRGGWLPLPSKKKVFVKSHVTSRRDTTQRAATSCASDSLCFVCVRVRSLLFIIRAITESDPDVYTDACLAPHSMTMFFLYTSTTALVNSNEHLFVPRSIKGRTF